MGRGASKASQLLAIEHIAFATETYGRGGYTAQPTPNFGALVGAGGDVLYLLTPDGDDAVRWPITDVRSADAIRRASGPVPTDLPPRVPFLVLGAGELVQDFDLAPMQPQDHLYRFNVGQYPDLWGVETVETQTPGARVERRVWCRLTERGSGVGQIRITTPGASRQQQRESCSITIRYSPDLAIGQEIVDWRGRVWDVDSSRTILDERYLVFECSRAVDATPPDITVV